MSEAIFTVDDDNSVIRYYPSRVPASSLSPGHARRGVIKALLPSWQALAEYLGRVTGTTWTVVDAEAQDGEVPQVTGETITDEQIKRLRRMTLGTPKKSADDLQLIELCTVAVTDRRAMAFRMPGVAEGVARAREACAAAYNARFGARL